jgi:hypothetical protein
MKQLWIPLAFALSFSAPSAFCQDNTIEGDAGGDSPAGITTGKKDAAFSGNFRPLGGGSRSGGPGVANAAEKPLVTKEQAVAIGAIAGSATEAVLLYCRAHEVDCKQGGGARPLELKAAINKGATAQQAADRAWYFFQNAEFEDGTPYRTSYNCHTLDHGCDQNTAYGWGLTPAEFAKRFKPHFCQGETYDMRHAASAPGTSWEESLRIDPYLKSGPKNGLTPSQQQCSNTGWGFIKDAAGNNVWVGADYNNPGNTPATAQNTACGRGSAAVQREEAYDSRAGRWLVNCEPAR